MKLKFVLPAALAVCSAFACTAPAIVYIEAGDAGDLPATAQVVSGAANTALTGINGALTLTNSLSDSDLYKIYINDPANFSASNTAFVIGANNFDSQIFLFNSAGLGVVGNDDSASGGAQSAIPAGSISSVQAGVYYLLISGSGRYAISSGGLIFPNFTDGTTDQTATVGPTGPGGSSAITGYSGSSNEGGSYRIALTGAQFVVVPEPGTYAFVLAGAAGLGLVLHARRRATAVA